jgi:hypothetical protein
VLFAALAVSCGDGGTSVEIAIGGTDEQSYPFVFAARGAAAADGVVCSAGDVIERSGASGAARNELICTDGSGSFLIETVIDRTGFEGEGLPESDWAVASGTGRYADLTGNGTHRWFGPDETFPQDGLDAVLQILEGTMELP